MLGVLAELACFLPLTQANGRQWLDVDGNWAERMMPFWTDYDIQRISRSLHDKGVIQLGSAPFVESRRLTLSFDSAPTQPSLQIPGNTSPLTVAPQITPGANLIPPHWQPDQELLKQIAQYAIPPEFVWQQLPEFVTYWRERGETSHSWGAKFLKDVLHKWRNYETLNARQQREDKERQVRERDAEFLKRDQEVAMHSQWRPTRDALEVLVKHAGISLAFVEDSIPEFVVYWQERGEVGRTWNSKFIQHVKRQWLRYNSALEHSQQVNHAGQQIPHSSGRTRDSSLAEQLNDRSWAS